MTKLVAKPRVNSIVKIEIKTEEQIQACIQMCVPLRLHNRKGKVMSVCADDAKISIDDETWWIPIICLHKADKCKKFNFYDKKYKLTTKFYEFSEDCGDEYTDITYVDAHTIVGKLRDIIYCARSMHYDTINTNDDNCASILWDDDFFLHHIFGDYTLSEVK